MMRIVLGLLLVIAMFAGLLLFPNIASQPVRIEMLGWLFETRTGMFVLLLLVVYGLVWLVNKVWLFGVNSPKQLWTSLRRGSGKRHDLRLQQALAVWIDEGAGNSQKLLKKSKGVVPDWLYEALLVWLNDPAAQPKIDGEQDSPLCIALKARLATDAEHIGKLSLSERQLYLDAWLTAHPSAPLALQRKAVLLGEMGEYAEQVRLLDQLWLKKTHTPSLKTKYATALRLAAAKTPEYALPQLRKALRIDPDDAAVVMALAAGLAAHGDTQSGERMLLEFVEKHDDMKVAEAALAMLVGDALQHYKKVDKPSFQKTIAGSWLRLMLAHQAALTGLAEDGLNSLLQRSPSAKLWQTRAAWYAEKQQWQKAVECYQQASACEH